jgi:hypothetical protein
MAQRIVVQFVDDLDGTPLSEGAGGTVSFALDGTNYEIDLSNENADRLRDGLAEFVRAARKVGGRAGSRRSAAARSSSSSSAVNAAAVREWARTEGIQVSERGRVSSEIIDAYNAKH